MRKAWLLEAWQHSTTAHILGGAVIGADATSGVVDAQSRLFGYRNFLVCDGRRAANPGVIRRCDHRAGRSTQ